MITEGAYTPAAVTAAPKIAPEATDFRVVVVVDILAGDAWERERGTSLSRAKEPRPLMYCREGGTAAWDTGSSRGPEDVSFFSMSPVRAGSGDGADCEHCFHYERVILARRGV